MTLNSYFSAGCIRLYFAQDAKQKAWHLSDITVQTLPSSQWEQKDYVGKRWKKLDEFVMLITKPNTTSRKQIYPYIIPKSQTVQKK